MHKKLLALLVSIAVMLGMGIFASPAQANLDEGDLQQDEAYCVGDPATKYWSEVTYTGDDSEFLHMIVRPVYQGESCSALTGQGLYNGEVLYGGTAPIVTDLVAGTKYCLGNLDTLVYTSRVYQTADDTSFKGFAIRKFPTTGDCSQFNGKPLLAAELVYYSYPEKPIPEPKIDVPASSTNAPDISPLPTNAPMYSSAGGAIGQLCYDTGQGMWFPYLDEGLASDAAFLEGKYIRPFPNTANGCNSYSTIPYQEWEQKYGWKPPSYLDPSVLATLPDGTSRTFDSPSSAGGEGGLDFGLSARTDFDGCDGQYRLQSSNWTLDFQYIYFDIIQVAKSAKIRLSVAVNYWFCPNGSKPDKVRPVSLQYIATHFKKPPWVYKEARFYPVISDSNSYIIPKQYKLPRKDDTLQQEARVYVPVADRKWLRVDQNAQWGNTTVLTLTNPSLDPTMTFHDYDNPNIKRKRFLPYSDQVLGDWITPW